MADAMEQVRETLGDDAVIISTHQGRRGTGVQVTAALDESPAEPVPPAEDPRSNPLAQDGGDNQIGAALQFHGLPTHLAERVTQMAMSMEVEDIESALAAALDAGFDFSPMSLTPNRPVMLVGQPGAGKTLTIAKLAARAVMEGQSVCVISTDTIRAGGIAQLSGFTDILGTELRTADSPDVLRSAIGEADEGDLILIDSPGVNPFNQVEIRDLKRFLNLGGIEPVLVAAAGGDVLEAADIATAFRPLGIRRMIFTRLDATRRYGAIVAAADSAAMMLGEVSLSPFVAEGLKILNPASMARLLLRQESIKASIGDKEEQAAE